jgi:hypothetical protein
MMFFFGKKNTENEAEVLNEPQQADETVEKIVLNEEGLELEFTQTEGAGNEVLPVDEAVPVGSVEVPDEAAEETECMPEAQENEPAPSMQDGAEPEGEECASVGSGNCCEDACGQLEKRVSGLHETLCRMQALLGSMYQNQQQMGMVQDSIVRGMQALQDKVENVVESQEMTIQKQHNAALKYQEDVIYKIQKNLIMELIGISDNIRMILQNSESEPGYDLLAAVKDLGAWVDASLSNNSVRRFQDTTVDATTMNRKRQQLVDKEPTDVEAEHNTYRTVSPGYEWSVPYLVVNSEVQLKKILEENAAPQMFTYVIRPEEIVKLEYSENNKEE